MLSATFRLICRTLPPRPTGCACRFLTRSATMSQSDGQLNTDLSVRVLMRTASMPWASSPSKTVWRKRVALEGPPEAGRVTSVVRYDPASRCVHPSRRVTIVEILARWIGYRRLLHFGRCSFPEHGHPDGEEILVLSGSWQDAHGDHPEGTFMLNPEGFRHAPGSKDGCELLVKLRQFGGPRREHRRIDTSAMEWQPLAGEAGVKIKNLYQDADQPEVMRLEAWASGTTVQRSLTELTEVFVLSGAFEENGDTCSSGDWVRLPAGRTLNARAETDCTVYIKSGVWQPQS
eukprot:m.197131 g.197131  ORF g.197131 m.197131 type:complete len:289 (+) comp18342_c0_seq7:181-1047(+)